MKCEVFFLSLINQWLWNVTCYCVILLTQSPLSWLSKRRKRETSRDFYKIHAIFTLLCLKTYSSLFSRWNSKLCVSRPNGMCFSQLLGKHRNAIFLSSKQSASYTSLCVGCLFEHPPIRTGIRLKALLGAFLGILSLMTWEFTTFRTFLDNFFFWVIYANLSFKLKEL